MKTISKVLVYSLIILSLGGIALAQQSASDTPSLYRGDAGRTGVADVSGLPEFSAIKWQADVGPSSLGSPLLVDGVLYVGVQDGTLRAFDAETGDVLWTFSGLGGHVTSAAVADGVVYVAGLEKTRWTALLVCLCGGVAGEEYDMEALLNKTARLHRESRGRLPWVAAIDARGWESRDFAERNIAMLNRAFKQDALGVKIWKNLGMAIKSKKPTGRQPRGPLAL
jgi:hypothetical protein